MWIFSEGIGETGKLVLGSGGTFTSLVDRSELLLLGRCVSVGERSFPGFTFLEFVTLSVGSLSGLLETALSGAVSASLSAIWPWLFSDSWGDLLESDVTGELQNWNIGLGELGQRLWLLDLVNVALEEIDQVLDADLWLTLHFIFGVAESAWGGDVNVEVSGFGLLLGKNLSGWKSWEVLGVDSDSGLLWLWLSFSLGAVVVVVALSLVLVVSSVVVSTSSSVRSSSLVVAVSLLGSSDEHVALALVVAWVKVHVVHHVHHHHLLVWLHHAHVHVHHVHHLHLLSHWVVLHEVVLWAEAHLSGVSLVLLSEGEVERLHLDHDLRLGSLERAGTEPILEFLSGLVSGQVHDDILLQLFVVNLVDLRSIGPSLDVSLEGSEDFAGDVGGENGVSLGWDAHGHYHFVLVNFQSFDGAQSLGEGGEILALG